MCPKTKILSKQIKVTVISWKDERWSADKDTLKSINEMLNKDAKRKSSLFPRINPEAFFLWLFYGVGFVLHGVMFLFKKLSRKT